MSWGRPWKKPSREIVERSYTQSHQRQQPNPPTVSKQGRVTYWSDNKEDQRTFYADAPENSQHAARLMKLAMQNQPEYAKAEKTHRKDRQIPSQVLPYAQIRPTEIYRYERDGQITYHRKAAGGELMISAPQSSQEAQSMDNAAAKLCTSQQYPASR